MTAIWQRHPVGIVGLGLIGGSLGLDLCAAGATVQALVHREATAERARLRGLAQVVSTDPAVLEGCALVVLALPLDRLLDPDPSLVAALPPEAVITDVGSVKAPVLSRWESLLGERGGAASAARFVPGHPMAGTARAGVEAGVSGLFRERPWVGTPGPRTDPAAAAAVEELALAVGARWIRCGAEEHDRAVALISHLPVLVGAALLLAADRGAQQARLTPASGIEVSGEPGGGLPELVRALASSGFADTTRVGGGNPELGTLIARCNRSAVLECLSTYRRCLDQLETLVSREDWPELSTVLEECRDLREEFL